MRTMRIRSDQGGVTAVEYGLVVAGVGLVFVLAGPQLYATFLALLDAILDGMVG